MLCPAFSNVFYLFWAGLMLFSSLCLYYSLDPFPVSSLLLSGGLHCTCVPIKGVVVAVVTLLLGEAQLLWAEGSCLVAFALLGHEQGTHSP